MAASSKPVLLYKSWAAVILISAALCELCAKPFSPSAGSLAHDNHLNLPACAGFISFLDHYQDTPDTSKEKTWCLNSVLLGAIFPFFQQAGRSFVMLLSIIRPPPLFRVLSLLSFNVTCSSSLLLLQSILIPAWSKPGFRRD